MIGIGDAARRIRDAQGLSQKDAARKLGITTVYLCNIEKNKAQPSASLIEKYRELWGVDVYVLAWCEQEDTGLPAGIREAASALRELWSQELKSIMEVSSVAGAKGRRTPK